MDTVIDWLVEPLDQVLPVAFDEVKVTEPPEQKVVMSLGVIVGVVGTGFTITAVAVEVELQEPLETVTL